MLPKWGPATHRRRPAHRRRVGAHLCRRLAGAAARCTFHPTCWRAPATAGGFALPWLAFTGISSAYAALVGLAVALLAPVAAGSGVPPASAARAASNRMGSVGAARSVAASPFAWAPLSTHAGSCLLYLSRRTPAGGTTARCAVLYLSCCCAAVDEGLHQRRGRARGCLPPDPAGQGAGGDSIYWGGAGGRQGGPVHPQRRHRGGSDGRERGCARAQVSLHTLGLTTCCAALPCAGLQGPKAGGCCFQCAWVPINPNLRLPLSCGKCGRQASVV